MDRQHHWHVICRLRSNRSLEGVLVRHFDQQQKHRPTHSHPGQDCGRSAYQNLSFSFSDRQAVDLARNRPRCYGPSRLLDVGERCPRPHFAALDLLLWMPGPIRHTFTIENEDIEIELPAGAIPILEIASGTCPPESEVRITTHDRRAVNRSNRYRERDIFILLRDVRSSNIRRKCRSQVRNTP